MCIARFWTTAALAVALLTAAGAVSAIEPPQEHEGTATQIPVNADAAVTHRTPFEERSAAPSTYEKVVDVVISRPVAAVRFFAALVDSIVTYPIALWQRDVEWANDITYEQPKEFLVDRPLGEL